MLTSLMVIMASLSAPDAATMDLARAQSFYAYENANAVTQTCRVISEGTIMSQSDWMRGPAANGGEMWAVYLNHAVHSVYANGHWGIVETLYYWDFGSGYEWRVIY